MSNRPAPKPGDPVVPLALSVGPTYYRWQQLYGVMKATEAKRLKEL